MKARLILSEVNSALIKFKWGQGQLTLQVGKKKQIAYSAAENRDLLLLLSEIYFPSPGSKRSRNEAASLNESFECILSLLSSLGPRALYLELTTMLFFLFCFVYSAG